MLVLLSFGLVLVAAVLLVIGLVSDSGGLTLIYLSIASSLVAGVLLFLSYAKLGKKPAVAPAAVETVPAAPPAPAPEPTPAPVVDHSAFAPEPSPATAATGVVAVDEEDFFPIADYDDLTVAQILPLLPELYADEVDVVAEREQAGRSRPEILGRLAELRDLLRDAPSDATGSSVAAAAPPAPEPVKRAATKTTAAKKAPVKKAAVPVKKAAAPVKRTPAKKAAAPAVKVPAKKVAATKAAPAKKAPAVKVPAKKAAATKAPAKKATKATKKA